MKNQGQNLSEKMQIDDQLLDVILTNINDVIAFYSVDGVCQYISPSVFNVLGYSPDEVVENAWMSYCHPDDALRANEHFNNAKQGRPAQITRIECRCRRKEGNYCWLETEVSRIYDENKVLLGFLMISRNITARKQVEQALEGSYEQMLLALNASKAGVWGFQPAINYGMYFRQWWELLGYAAGDKAVDAWFELCHPADRKQIGALLKNCADDENLHTVKIKFRIRHKDGSYHWFLASGRKILGLDFGHLQWTGIVVDVTEMEALEASRNESERRLRDFARAFRDVSAIIDENGKYIEVVTQNEALLSHSADSLKGSSLYGGCFAEKAEFIVRQIRRAIKMHHLQTCSFEYFDKARRQFVEMRIAPMNYLADGVKTAAVVFSWINEEMRTEQMMDFTLLLKRRSLFMETLLQGARKNLDNAVQPETLGIDFSVTFFCCLIELKNIGESRVLDQFNKRQLLVIKYLSEVQGLFVWDYQGKIGVLVNVDAVRADVDDMQTVQNILEMITDYDPLLTSIAGVSRRHKGFAKVGKSCSQAAKALLVAESGQGVNIYHFRELGVYRILAGFNGEDAQDYVQEMIGGLIAHDRCYSTDLLHTLEIILQCDNLKEAAQQLFFHYNTVVRKKHRIEAILGHDLSDIETKLALITAIKLHQLMKQRDNE